MKIYKIAQYVSLECTDCKKSTTNEGYMLKDDLWNQIATKEENLCIDCLEKRLGRQLNKNDFMDIDYNFWEGSMKHKSPKLINRLTKNTMKIWKIAQHKPWEMTRQEFIDYHYTGDIRSGAYDSYSTVEGLSWLKKEKYPILYSVKQFGKHQIEFRKSGEKLKYTQNDAEGEIVRDENGLALMMSDEDVRKQGRPLEDQTIVAFDGNNAIGLASDEWGADGIWVVKAYQRLGIGVYLLSEFRKNFPDKRKIGQMTADGYWMSQGYHKKEVKDAIERGDFTPESPRYEEILNDYPEFKQ